jgi:alpha-glucosidase
MVRYQFPSTPLRRAAAKLGLGDFTRGVASDGGEALGAGIFRFHHVRCDRATLPPSVAVVGGLTASGPASACREKPRFWRTWDGRECVGLDAIGCDLYGTGEIAGPLRRNGKVTVCWNSDVPGYTEEKNKSLYQSHPWVVAVRADGTAFGVLADTTWRCEIDLSGATGQGIVFRSRGPAFSVYVVEGDSPQRVLTRLSELVGRIEMPPVWALGYHQCRFSYEPDAQVRQIADTFREKSIPCDVIWMDIDYMEKYRIFTFDPVKFADPKGLNDYLHERGFKAVWMIDPAPAAEDGYGVYEEGVERDVFTKTWDGKVFRAGVWPPDCAFPDFTREDVCRWWGGLYKEFMATGVDGVWNDMNEPAIIRWGTEGPHTMPDDNEHRGGVVPEGHANTAGRALPAGPHAQYHNLYGFLMVRASRLGIMEANPDKRPFVLTRANFMGGHRYAATWTGDNRGTWDDVHWTIAMMLNMGLSAQPLCGPDLGGFIAPGTPEMMAHWWGFGTMLPFCRGHAAKDNIQKEPWVFGPEVEQTIRRAIQRRYRMLPYFYTLFRESSLTGMPVCRPTFFADPRDARLRGEDHSFLVGDGVLVLANDTEGAMPRHVLPTGIWREFEPVAADERAEVKGAMARLMIRGGSIVPMGPVMEHTGQRALDPLTLVVCLDESGKASGELYEDAGEGFGYRSGAYRQTRFEARVERGADGTEVVVSQTKTGGQWGIPDRTVEVEVVTDSGVRRGAGRGAGEIRVRV